MRERRVSKSRVSITKNEDEGQAVNEGLDLLEIGKTVRHDDTVVITANNSITCDVIGTAGKRDC